MGMIARFPGAGQRPAARGWPAAWRAAGTYQASGHPRKARRHWRQALTLYTRLGAPEADQIRAQLAAANQGQYEPFAAPHAAV
jgi:hypothetical protein